MSLKLIRQAIAEAVTSTGIPCTPTMPSVINPPCAFPLPVSVSYDVVIPRNWPQYKLDLVILLTRQGLIEEAQEDMDTYLEIDSIKSGVEGAALGTSANFLHVKWRGYEQMKVNDTTYLSAHFDIDTF